MLSITTLLTSLSLSLLGLQPATTAPKTPEKQPQTEPAKPTAPALPAAASPAVTPVDRKSDDWARRHESINARVKQGREQGDIGMVFIGDSITEAWEGDGKAVWMEFYAKRNAANLGIGGDQTQHVLWRLEHGNLDGLATPAKGESPKLAVIMIGTNNASSTPPEHIAAGITAIVAKVKEKLPKSKILVLAIFPREEKPGKLRDTNAKASELAKKVADDNTVFFMDIGSALKNADGTLSKDIMPDFLHLSAEGYRRWAIAIEPKVKELMGEK